MAATWVQRFLLLFVNLFYTLQNCFVFKLYTCEGQPQSWLCAQPRSPTAACPGDAASTLYKWIAWFFSTRMFVCEYWKFPTAADRQFCYVPRPCLTVYQNTPNTPLDKLKPLICSWRQSDSIDKHCIETDLGVGIIVAILHVLYWQDSVHACAVMPPHQTAASSSA